MRIFKKNGGFTLVELIVVIAILAILAGVAIPAYSGYVTKANKTADQTLISDVAHALQLHYYSNPDNAATGGVVAFLADGTFETRGFGDEAMKAVFGDNWKQTLKLKYDNWNGGITDVLAGYTDAELKAINTSTFMTASSTESMMNTVNTLTNTVSAVIDAKNYTEAQIVDRLKQVLGDTEETRAMISTLQTQNLLQDSTALTNMLVGSVAESMGQNPVMQQIITEYSNAFAYAEKTGDRKAYDKMTANLANMTMSALTETLDPNENPYVAFADTEAFRILYAGADSGDDFDGCGEYLSNSNNAGALENDKNALVAMMGAVQGITGNFQDKNSLTDKNLFTSADMMSQVDGFMGAVEALGAMDATARDNLMNDLPDGAVTVLVGADGKVVVWPGNAWVG